MACVFSTGHCTSEHFEFLWLQKEIDIFLYRSYKNVFTPNGNPQKSSIHLPRIKIHINLSARKLIIIIITSIILNYIKIRNNLFFLNYQMLDVTFIYLIKIRKNR